MRNAPGHDLYRASFDAAMTGLAVVTASGDIVVGNRAFFEMTGGASQGVEAEARARAPGVEATRAVREVMQRARPRCVVRCAPGDRHLLVCARPLPLRADGASLFLTEWRYDAGDSAMEDALRESERRVRQLQENLPVGIYRAGEDGTIETANPALLSMMGYESFAELENAALDAVWVDPQARSVLIERLRDEGAVIGYTASLRRKDGSELIGSFDARGTFDAQGRLLYFDTIVQDMTERVRAQRELERLARIDTLTGLFNRQYLMTRLAAEVARAARYPHPLCLMIIDLDHFKAVNDTYGHLAGDQVLTAAASVLAGSLRATDFTGRYGGEEFCVVLPETSADEAALVAERIRATLANTPVTLQGGASVRVTCSIGLAEAQAPDIDALVACADAALYEAKRRGRNRVVRGERAPSGGGMEHRAPPRDPLLRECRAHDPR